MHLGHGATIRKFKEKEQYKLENLSTPVLNKIYGKNGVLKGTGFKGTRGKYEYSNFKRYQPKKKMKRSKESEEMLRHDITDVFKTYSTTNNEHKNNN